MLRGLGHTNTMLGARRPSQVENLVDVEGRFLMIFHNSSLLQLAEEGLKKHSHKLQSCQNNV